jgi:hypothetical protein
MMENLKNVIHQSFNELFATAVLDEMAGDIPSYKEKLQKIGQITEILGLETEITEITLKLKE